ncbi:hypothetical protein BH10PSE7_BH10PSE7_30160 [soil metagenome]
MIKFKHALARLLCCALLFGLGALAAPQSASARFLQPDTWDPILLGVDINRYAYAGNDPINGSDPNEHNADPMPTDSMVDHGDVYGEWNNLSTRQKVLNVGAALIDAAGNVAIAADIAAFGPTGEGIVPGMALKQFAKSIVGSAEKGRFGEGVAKAWVERAGQYEVVSVRQTVTTQNGEKRVLDMLVRDKKTNKLYNMEVKTDGGKVTSAQLRKDADISSDGGTLKGDRAGDYKDTLQKIDTLDVRVDSSRGCVTSCTPRSEILRTSSGGTSAAGGSNLSNVFRGR